MEQNPCRAAPQHRVQLSSTCRRCSFLFSCKAMVFWDKVRASLLFKGTATDITNYCIVTHVRLLWLWQLSEVWQNKSDCHCVIQEWAADSFHWPSLSCTFLVFVNFLNFLWPLTGHIHQRDTIGQSSSGNVSPVYIELKRTGYSCQRCSSSL